VHIAVTPSTKQESKATNNHWQPCAMYAHIVALRENQFALTYSNKHAEK